MKKVLTEFEQSGKQIQLFAIHMHQIIDSFLCKNSMKVQSFTYRIKGLSSLYEKVKNKKGNQCSVAADFVGMRVILYFRSDIDIVISILKNAFAILEEKDIGKSYSSSHRSIGYHAKHIIFTLNEDRLQLHEYEAFRDLRCEVQVTTVLEHAWSEIEHTLLYKNRHSLTKKEIQSLENNFTSITKSIRRADKEIQALSGAHTRLI